MGKAGFGGGQQDWRNLGSGRRMQVPSRKEPHCTARAGTKTAASEPCSDPRCAAGAASSPNTALPRSSAVQAQRNNREAGSTPTLRVWYRIFFPNTKFLRFSL